MIDAPVYLRHFSSDRSHMYDFETKTWNAPPPSYDCILLRENSDRSRSDSKGNNVTITSAPAAATPFKQYMTISNENVADSQQNGEDHPFGRIYSLSQLLQRFGANIENTTSPYNK